MKKTPFSCHNDCAFYYLYVFYLRGTLIIDSYICVRMDFQGQKMLFNGFLSMEKIEVSLIDNKDQVYAEDQIDDHVSFYFSEKQEIFVH